jgi:hypothetical protein
MTNPFAAAISAAAKVHDSIMGESFDYRPMAQTNDVNAKPSADGTRAIVTGLRLPFGEPTARFDSGAMQTPGVRAERPGHATARPFVSLDLSLLPYAPKRGDRVLRVANGALYQIAEILPSTPGFARLDLNII